MKIQTLLKRFGKLRRVTQSRQVFWAFARRRVLAGTEHRQVLSNALRTVVDIGANRGQFALAVRLRAPEATVISFEPLVKPADTFRAVFREDTQVTLHQAAIGPEVEQRRMHISGRDDSSSLLPISAIQRDNYPGTGEVGTATVLVAPLSQFVTEDTIVRPSLLKLDVQGFEFEALLGCEPLLSHFDHIYCECSFVELYEGQRLASEVIDWLSTRGFQIAGLYNCEYDPSGMTLQADILFRLRTPMSATKP